MIGKTFSHYRIVEKLGEGGMGVVYLAADTRLDRRVAIKVLRLEAAGDSERQWRFEREAKAASALNHPNIVTIYDIGESEGATFIAMEYVEGTTLDRMIPSEGLPVQTALDYASQIAAALAAAHSAGIVHRDVKPGNVAVTPGGTVKVLDFGLAKLVEPGANTASPASIDSTATAAAAELRTRQGVILGTLAYMSPEQVEGKPVDARSDVFSFGAVLYEMLAGRRPFVAESGLTTMAAILRDPTPPLRGIRHDLPRELEAIVRRCLEKRPEARYESAVPLAADLREVASQSAPRSAGRVRLRKRSLVLAAAALLVAIAIPAYFLWRNGRGRWARDVALPEVARLTDRGQLLAAFRLASRAERWAPQDVARLRKDLWWARSVRTEPPGADVYFKGYLEPGAPWHLLGRSPLSTRLPFGNYRWRLVRQGREPLEVVDHRRELFFRLSARGSLPAGMALAYSGRPQIRTAPPVKLGDFWIDRFEVTNRQFQEFVNRGGYQDRRYWTHPFVENGATIAFPEAMARFRDATGRPGPATWELGAFPEGRGDFPVGGVSWYEAGAYAEFAGKSLPTIYHWRIAADIGLYSDILAFANFGGAGPWRVGSAPGLSAFGTYDMAGNVKEWCSNGSEGEKRYILGGGFDDPSYIFADLDAQPPFARRPSFGFRCVRYSGPVEAALTAPAPVQRLIRDYTKEKPVSDEVFGVYRGLYAYDRGPLDARVEAVDETSPHWRKEKVSFSAGYGKERVTVYVFLPRDRPGPFQTVIYFPAGYAMTLRSSEQIPMREVDFVVRSGRALIFPVYAGTFERHVDGPTTPLAQRDRVLHWRRELGRCVDYVETRRDLDAGRLAFYGSSMGADAGGVLLAMENRFRTAVLSGGGLDLEEPPPREIDAINFLPRIRMPVLMIDGRHDFYSPVESSQLPMFRLLGTPEGQKKHVLLESGHAMPMQSVVPEVLDWLDRYLGPVANRRRGASGPPSSRSGSTPIP